MGLALLKSFFPLVYLFVCFKNASEERIEGLRGNKLDTTCKSGVPLVAKCKDHEGDARCCMKRLTELSQLTNPKYFPQFSCFPRAFHFPPFFS